MKRQVWPEQELTSEGPCEKSSANQYKAITLTSLCMSNSVNFTHCHDALGLSVFRVKDMAIDAIDLEHELK